MKTLNYIAAYLLWMVNALFGLWLIFICRNTWLAVLYQYYVNGSVARANRARFIDPVLSILFGLTWFFLLIAFEAYFKKGVEKGDLMRRFSKATGPIVLAFASLDLILSLIQGLAIVGWLRVLIILIELILGILLVRYGWGKKALVKQAGQTTG